jgi:hypothetical protein
MAELIELASKMVEHRFDKSGQVEPRYIAVTAAGQVFIVPPPPCDRQTATNLVRELFVEHDVVAYVYFDEAYIAEGKTKEEAFAGLDRQQHEAVVISAESEREGQRFALRKIVRPTGRKAYLEPLVIEDFHGASGNIVGMLARRTTLQ